MTPDWPALLARAQELDAPLTAEELELWKRGIIDGNARMWNVEYVHAAQRALEGRDREQLLAMMRAEIPIPAFLLPIVASLNEPHGGRPAQFTALEDRLNLQWFEKLTRFFGRSDTEALAELAQMRGVSKKTIERSLERAKLDKTPPTI